jgi:hypothetical protein
MTVQLMPGGLVQQYYCRYEKKGLLTSDDGSIAILAGATFGGGTSVNWVGGTPFDRRLAPYLVAGPALSGLVAHPLAVDWRHIW